MNKRTRRSLIKLLAQTDRYEEGSLIRSPSARELAESRRHATSQRQQAGALWVFRHRGLGRHD